MIPFFWNTTPRHLANTSQLSETKHWYHLQKYTGTLTLEGETSQNTGYQTSSYMAYYRRRTDFSAIPLRRFESRKTLVHILCLCLISAFIKEWLQIRKHLYEVICINGLLDDNQS